MCTFGCGGLGEFGEDIAVAWERRTVTTQAFPAELGKEREEVGPREDVSAILRNHGGAIAVAADLERVAPGTGPRDQHVVVGVADVDDDGGQGCHFRKSTCGDPLRSEKQSARATLTATAFPICRMISPLFPVKA